jgi:ABC-2 type transport system permease protein
MKPAIANHSVLPADVAVGRGFDLTALGALFVLTLRQHIRGRRLLVLSLLFLLPSVLVVLVQLARHPPEPEHLDFALLFNLMPYALAPLTALLYAAGMIQDEVEEQTLTYLLVRPLPRWALYVTKFAATLLVTTLLTATFTTLTLVVIHWNTPELWGDVLPGRALQVAGLYALAQAGYCSFFGAMSLFTRRSMIAGLAYVLAFEGLLANFRLVTRQLTVMYNFRVLAIHWVDPQEKAIWSIEPQTMPSAGECLLTLLGASLVFVILGAMMTMRQEFRMKTPEGS